MLGGGGIQAFKEKALKDFDEIKEPDSSSVPAIPLHPSVPANKKVWPAQGPSML